MLSLLCNATSENRGKKSVRECVERARTLGITRLLFVYEKQGNPNELIFYDASAQNENEEGAWLEPSITILGFSFPKQKLKLGRALKHVSVKPLDAEGEEIRKLFAFENELEEFEEVSTRELVQIIAGKGRLSFKIAGKQVGPVLKIKLKHSTTRKS